MKIREVIAALQKMDPEMEVDFELDLPEQTDATHGDGVMPIARRKPGRPKKPGGALTSAERQRAYRDRKRAAAGLDAT